MIKAYLSDRFSQSQGATLSQSLINWILPPVCVSCQTAGQLFCDRCSASVTWAAPSNCFRCGQPAPNLGSVCLNCRTAPSALDNLYAATVFSGPIRPAVHALKYQGKFGVAAALANLMQQRWPSAEQPDMLVPVPLHPDRYQERGYNQSEALAQSLAERSGLPLVTDALFRVRATRQQVGLNERQRQRNVVQAFQAVPQRVAGKHILLIDDVCTTGSTLLASAETLAKAGAASISAFCLAQARDPRDHHYDLVDAAPQQATDN